MGVRPVSPELVIACISLLGTAVGGWFIYAGTRGKTRADAKSALDARIDERVQAELERVYARVQVLEEELETMKASESSAVRTTDRIRSVVRTWFSELRAWDRSGHVGPLPLPSDESMRLLDLEYPKE